MSVASVASTEVESRRASGPQASKVPPQRWSRRVAIDIVGLIDIACVIAGGIVPAFVFPVQSGHSINWVLMVQGSVLAGVLAGLCFKAWDFYDSKHFDHINANPLLLLATLSIVIGAVLGLSMPNAVASGNILGWEAAWAGSSFAMLFVTRNIAHLALNRLVAAGRFDQRIAVFGAGSIARRVHDHLANVREGIHFAGVFDDRIGENRINPEGLPIAGRLTELIDAARTGHIDQIVIALPQSADRRIADIARKLEQLPVSIHIVTHISSDFIENDASHRVSNVGPVGLMDVKKKALADWAPLIKMTEDYVLGAVILLLAAPLFPLIALAIKLDSPGPVLFVQRRRGLNQRIINVLKFRTMRVLEDGANVRQVAKGDPRITRVGRFLRSSSLDELPQLFNVLRGDMSLVGPRPHALVHDEQYGEMLETYANRHQVKPGITGLAQVRGYRGETSSTDKMQARVENDIAYIKSWSLSLDLKILAQTIRAVTTRKNAH